MGEPNILTALMIAVADAREAARDMTAEPEEIRRWADTMEASGTEIARLRKLVEDTKERCAQIAESYGAAFIPRAIRAIKMETGHE